MVLNNLVLIVFFFLYIHGFSCIWFWL